MEKYTLVLGETGNEVGHPQIIRARSIDTARATARRMCSRTYHGDGWYVLSTSAGESLDRGGRR